MAKFRYLKNAPIIETVVDVRAQSSVKWDDSSTRTALLEQLGANYGKKIEDMREITVEVQQQVGQPVVEKVHDGGMLGLRFFSNDESYIVQFRRDGFTCSRMAPYTGWQVAFAEASRLWAMFFRVAAPEQVSRIAVRTINRVALPLDKLKTFQTFLVNVPTAPLGMPVGAFMSRVVAKDVKSDLRASIMHVLQEKPENGKLPVVLDIDVFRQKGCSPEPDKLLPEFEPLHQLKNELFFASITEEAASLFE